MTESISKTPTPKYARFSNVLKPLKEDQKRSVSEFQTALNIYSKCIFFINDICDPDQSPKECCDEEVLFMWHSDNTVMKATVCRDHIPNLIDMLLHFGIMPFCTKCDDPSFDEQLHLATSDRNVYFTCSDECRKSIKWYYDQLKIGPNCPVCFAPGCTLMCGQCKKQKYCSKECQVQHWRQKHKKECQPESKTVEI
jgi:hypothetical protein